MGSAERQAPQQADTPSATLGDILFAGPGQPTPESEWAALVRAIASRDEQALHALYRRTNRIVFTLSLRITGSRETAEEVALDVFHEVWRRAPDYDPAEGSVVGWVMNLTRSRAIDRVRFDGRKKRVDPSPEAQESGSGAEQHEALEIEEQGRLLRGALELLTREERSAIEMAFFSGLTHAETAAELDTPLGTVKARIRAALQKLRVAMMNGGTP